MPVSKVTQIKPTSRIKRILAAAIDTSLAVVLIALLSISLLIGVKNLIDNPTKAGSYGLVAISMLTGALVCLVAIIYQILLPFVWFGQSLGMRIMRIKLVNEKGDHLTLRQLIVRSMAVVFIFIASGGISLISEIFIVALSEDHRSFTDTISRVYCIDAKENQKIIIEGEQ